MRRASCPALVVLALVPGSALADNGYEAQFVGRSPDVTVESGEIAMSSFQVRNAGTKLWQTNRAVAPPVRLGTSNPRDRGSAFELPDWVNDNRPAQLDRSPVRPGEQGAFVFRMQAPAVAAPTTFVERFEPVADAIPGDIGGWMGSNAGPPNWPINGIPIAYRVLPAAPPAVKIDAAPATARTGTAIDVTATATDNVRVSRLELRLAGREPVMVDAQADRTTVTATAKLDAAGLPAGRHAIEVTAVDGAGRSAVASGQVALEDPPPVANGANATRSARLAAGFGRRRLRARTTVSYGRRSTLRGRLTGDGGAAIAGAVVKIATRVLSGRRGFRELSTPLTTDAQGGFAYEAPPGASRQIRLSYTAFSNDPGPAAVQVLRFSTRAGVRVERASHAGAQRAPCAPGRRAARRPRAAGGRPDRAAGPAARVRLADVRDAPSAQARPVPDELPLPEHPADDDGAVPRRPAAPDRLSVHDGQLAAAPGSRAAVTNAVLGGPRTEVELPSSCESASPRLPSAG